MAAPNYLIHTTQTGDRLDLLAWRYYGDPFEWPRISRANPSAALAALREPVLASGTVLHIPLVSEVDLLTRQTFAPWRT